MKNVLLSGLYLLLAGMLLMGRQAQAQELPIPHNAESHLLIKVEKLSLADYNQLVAIIAREPDITLEYGCVEFGIIALKFKHNSLSEPDIKTYILDRITPALGGKRGEIIHLETHITASGRC